MNKKFRYIVSIIMFAVMLISYVMGNTSYVHAKTRVYLYNYSSASKQIERSSVGGNYYWVDLGNILTWTRLL